MAPLEKRKYSFPPATAGLSSRIYATALGGVSSIDTKSQSLDTAAGIEDLQPPTTSVVFESEMIAIQGMECCFYTWKSTKQQEDSGIPMPQPQPKALIVYLHGANTHGTFPTTRYICDNVISNGYAFMSFDFPGHGRTSGLRGMLKSPDLLINFGIDAVQHAVRTYEKQVAQAMQAQTYPVTTQPGMKVFLIGSSMGANISLQVALRRRDLVTGGVVLLAPMLKLPFSRPTRLLLKATASVLPFQEAIPVGDNTHYRCPAKLKECEADKLKPFSKGDKIRLGTCSTLVGLTLSIQSQFDDITFPYCVMIGEEDTIVDNSGAVDLVNKSPSKDKILKRYPAKHGLMGEPSPLFERLQSDIVGWMDERCPLGNDLPVSRL